MAEKKSILVVGGAGYIGSHVSKTLAESGMIPVTLDNLSTGRRDFVLWGPFVFADIKNTAAVGAIISKYNISAAVDLSGCSDVGESVSDPMKYYENNVSAKINFLRVIHEMGVDAVVFSSSASVYGEGNGDVMSEISPISPKSPYGRTKAAMENILRDYYISGGPSYISLRYFNVSGASSDADIGEARSNESHLIPNAYFSATGRTNALKIYGDGTAVRDYVHVEDIANANVMAIERLFSSPCAETYNLGTGIGASVKQVLDGFSRMGFDVPHEFSPKRPGDPSYVVADITKAREGLSWSPKNSSIENIIKSTIRWYDHFFL